MVARSEFIDKLAGSGLTKRHAAQLKITEYTTVTARKLPIRYAREGFKIPYFSAAGKPTQFFRYRYLCDPRPKLERITDTKPLRYVQPPDTLPEVYMPPMIDWRKVLKDPSEILLITEGELKAACACIHTDHPTVGLGGVWSWRSAKHQMDMIPWFTEVTWKERTVYIVFDSDAATNPNVLQAEGMLAQRLLRLGAVLYIVRLPAREDGEKQGLDDYIVAKGADTLTELLEGTEPYIASLELHRLNTEVVYVRNPGIIYRFDNKQRISVPDYINHAYATRTYMEYSVNKKTGATLATEKSAPREWIKWRGRSEVERLDYLPGKELVSDNVLNVWPGWGCEPKESSVSLWNRLLDHLFTGSPKQDRVWFEQWLAYPIQYPGTKLFTSAVLWGLKHGTGKSLVGYTMFKIYGKNAVELEESHLKQSFNEWAENIQFAMGEEITGGDKRGMADSIKHMISRRQLRLNPKYIPSYTTQDIINYIFTSNHPDSFFIEDNDRRYFVHEVTVDPLPTEFYTEYDAWLHGGEAGPAIFDHLLNIDLSGFNPLGAAPMTASKQQMIVSGKSDLGDWISMLKQHPDSVLRVGNVILPYTLWRNQDLLRIYDPEGKRGVTANGLGRELKRAGFIQVCGGRPVRTESVGMARLWVVRDPGGKLVKETSGPRLATLYDRERADAGRKKGKL